MTSFALGIAFGLIGSLLLKCLPTLKLRPTRETLLVLVIGYVAYLTADALNLSGIISLFCCGFTLAHYGYYNLSKQGRRGSIAISETLSYLAEAFLYTYLGLTLFAVEPSNVNIRFTAYMLGVMLACRAAAVFLPLLLILPFKRCRIDLRLNEVVLIFFAGVIRGALAFALSTQIVSDNADYLRAVCLSVVVFTIVVLGGVMALFAHVVGIKPPPVKNQSGIDVMEADASMIESESEWEPQVSRMHLCWRKFDEGYMKRFFGGKIRKQGTLDDRLVYGPVERTEHRNEPRI